MIQRLLTKGCLVPTLVLGVPKIRDTCPLYGIGDAGKGVLCARRNWAASFIYPRTVKQFQSWLINGNQLVKPGVLGRGTEMNSMQVIHRSIPQGNRNTWKLSHGQLGPHPQHPI